MNVSERHLPSSTSEFSGTAWCPGWSSAIARLVNCAVVNNILLRRLESLKIRPLIFSLVILKILDDIGHIDDLHFQLWYLDHGTFMGTRDAVCMMAKELISIRPTQSKQGCI